MADIEKDKKTWRSLVFEVVEGATEPPEFLLKKLANAVNLSELMAKTKFQEDVLAVKRLRQDEKAKENYEQKRADFLAEHATEAELQQQLADMLQQEKELRSLISKIKHIDFVIAGKQAATRRIGAAFNRIF